MPSRFKSRQIALQALYVWDVRKQPIDDVLRDFYDSLASEEGEPTEEYDFFARELAMGTVARIEEIDKLVGSHSAHWRIERMPVVDRNILRLAVYEMNALPTPSAVVIDQALELARRFAGDDSIAFLNGVLDAVNKEIRGD